MSDADTPAFTPNREVSSFGAGKLDNESETSAPIGKSSEPDLHELCSHDTVTSYGMDARCSLCGVLMADINPESEPLRAAFHAFALWAFGERCSVFDEDCAACEAWAKYDEVTK